MSREDVLVHAAKAKDELRRGALSPLSTGRLTFGEVADKYMEAFPTRSHHYVRGLKRALAHTPADDVTAADIKSVVKAWRTGKRTKAGTQGGAVAERHLLQTARHVYNWSIAEGYATRTPFKTSQGVNLIKVKSHVRARADSTWARRSGYWPSPIPT